MTKRGFLLPPIPPAEMTPTVKLLLAIRKASRSEARLSSAMIGSETSRETSPSRSG